MSRGLSMMSIRDFFTPLVEQRFAEADIHEPGVMYYVAELLERSAYSKIHSNPIFSVDRLSDAVKMRLECKDPEKGVFLDQHIGDYALLMNSLFFDKSRSKSYYTIFGKSSYTNLNAYYRKKGMRATASLFDALSDYFENCVKALSTMREKDLVIERNDNYDLLLMPKDREAATNLMLDAVNRWKTSRKPEDKKTALCYAERLGIRHEELFSN